MSRYFNQSRSIAPGVVPSEWGDVCGGHDDMYGAIACADEVRTVMNGTIPHGAKVGAPQLAAFSAKIAAVLKTIGGNMEMRIVKRTDEVVEDAQLVFIQPKGK